MTWSFTFSENGPLAAVLEAYAERAGQAELAAAVASAIETSSVLVAEAGTGVGKTLAYLLPVLASGKPAIISTGTKHLQDQLYNRDLPLAVKALGVSPELALLKGRSNYLCRYRLSLANSDRTLDIGELNAISQWAKRSISGDIAEFSELAEDAVVWPQVTSTIDNCLGQDCPAFDQCFVVKARRRAAAADLVVVNHHLLLADVAIKEDGFGELLPNSEVVVIDEAHQLPELAAVAFGARLSSRRLTDLVRDTIAEQLTAAADSPQLRTLAEALRKANADFRLALQHQPQRGSWNSCLEDPELRAGLRRLQECCAQLVEALEPQALRSPGLEACARRATQLMTELTEYDEPDEQADTVCWYEASAYGYVIHRTPLNVAPAIARVLAVRDAAWILTSATLSIAGELSYFCQRTGLESATQLNVGSPFDYARQGLLYLPSHLPAPSSEQFIPALLTAVMPLLAASKGRAFLLFTSYRALNFARLWLYQHASFSLLVQGEAPKSELLDRFVRQPNTILLGTASFWEGVDVRGSALSLVVIDKLPFQNPGDPVLQARAESLAQQGEDVFRDLQLPHAVLALKQGAGRLIRGPEDCGVLVLGDPRVLSKNYGATFLRSLPPMPVTQKVATAVEFLQALP